VPVDPEKVDEFDPENVPDVGRLLEELDASGKMDVDEEGSEQRNGEHNYSVVVGEAQN
jgi:DNA primase small subunit